MVKEVIRMKYINYSLSMNKIFTIAFLIAMIIMGVGKLTDLSVAIATYALLYVLREYFYDYEGEIHFYEFVNAGFLIAVNMFSWIVYMYTIILDFSSHFHI